MNLNIPDAELPDIHEIRVDRSLPRHERIAEFVRQVKNPYRLRCGKRFINTSFTTDGPTLEDCLLRTFE
jgi:hypothetical protein